MRDKAAGDAEFFAEPPGVERRGPAECDHGVFGEVLAVFHGMDAGGVGHVFVDDFGDPPGGFGRVHAKGVADMGGQRRL